MKKMTKLFALALLAGAMISCSTDDTASSTPNGKVAVQFTGGINVNTRAMMKTDTHAKDHNDGSINATAHQHHLSEVGTCGLYVVDSHRDKRKTRGINEDIDDRP